ncbi:uncharacterized protein LOC114960855 isoform X4 [Acropora millepora]|uniref:uncharacterized protein LOC114960855 isoform X4 n=1 Tax=Acropora millepora TaxID=45264 RepID=UPI001CF59A4B|nr:uncharacterized protein LOC114960855 isoform X4 [Acropora millepora]
MNWTESGTMKSVTRGMNNTSCGKCRRKKKSKDTKENNITMGTCLGLQSNGPTKILLVPCESQPSSSTRYWILGKRRGSQELKGKMKACGNSTELCGFLRRSSDEKSRNYEETHDAFLHTAATEN